MNPPPPPIPVSPESLRILLADDHEIFRQGVRVLLEREGFQLVGEAADGEEAVQLAQTLDPDVAILDLGMPGLNGIDAARRIRQFAPHTQTILLTMYEDETYLIEALRAGMHGYVLKSQTATALIETIKEVARGAMLVTPGISPAAVDAYASGGTSSRGTLTEREQEIVKMIADGKTNRVIADALGLSVKTIESHRSKIMEKLNIHRTAELIRYSIRHQLISP